MSKIVTNKIFQIIQVHQINISIQYFQGSLLFTALSNDKSISITAKQFSAKNFNFQ